SDVSLRIDAAAAEAVPVTVLAGGAAVPENGAAVPSACEGTTASVEPADRVANNESAAAAKEAVADEAEPVAKARAVSVGVSPAAMPSVAVVATAVPDAGERNAAATICSIHGESSAGTIPSPEVPSPEVPSPKVSQKAVASPSVSKAA
ncbi:unnamed protein product, partial [Phaeothamnion confervicola]